MIILCEHFEIDTSKATGSSSEKAEIAWSRAFSLTDRLDRQ